MPSIRCTPKAIIRQAITQNILQVDIDEKLSHYPRRFKLVENAEKLSNRAPTRLKEFLVCGGGFLPTAKDMQSIAEHITNLKGRRGKYTYYRLESILRL